jgi:hypothetical protein
MRAEEETMSGKTASRLIGLAAGVAGMMTAGIAGAADGVLKDRSIGYVMSEIYWGIYQTKDGKIECPNGFNDGPREQFKILFPDDGTKRTLSQTQLARESEIWFPHTTPEPYPFHEAVGTTAFGLNLDGKVGPNDFTSPDGEKGIDNQMYRALGCISNYRGPDGTLYHFTNNYMQEFNYDRILVELTNVDNLLNDDDVSVSIYRGRDKLLTDATGNDYLPGGSQRVDTRWGKEFIRHFHGKIVNGVLTTDAVDVVLPATAAFDDRTIQFIHGMRLKLKLTPQTAEGLMAGYTDVETFYRQLNESWSTHHQSYGQESSPSLYRALQRLADGYPDPKTGRNTAISSALEVKFKQVFIEHGAQETVSAKPTAPAATGER